MKTTQTIIALIGAVSADLGADWPLYTQAGISLGDPAAYGAGGGYSCLRAGYTWLPQMSVTGTAASKTVGTPSGAVWYRTADFTTAQSDIVSGVDSDEQLCCPALDTTAIGSNWANEMASHYDVCRPLFQNDGSTTVTLTSGMTYVNLANAGNADYNSATDFQTDFILASTWQPAYDAENER